MQRTAAVRDEALQKAQLDRGTVILENRAYTREELQKLVEKMSPSDQDEDDGYGNWGY